MQPFETLNEYGQLMFPVATVYVCKPDVDLWLDPTNVERSHLDRRYFDEAVRTTTPYLNAGKLERFLVRQPSYQASPHFLHRSTHRDTAFMPLKVGARVSSFAVILFTLLRFNLQILKLLLFTMSMPMPQRNNERHSLPV
ncbi:hypothetical protein H6F95_25160 [Cyanobacteria bacterium FACHB-471]|nr:hypothetical protein [Cyanobacteria bacterium FACHB-471]